MIMWSTAASGDFFWVHAEDEGENLEEGVGCRTLDLYLPAMFKDAVR